MTTPLRIVLDTNVLLDWLVFDDPLARTWSAAIARGAVEWVVTDRMRTEWQRVLTYEAVRRRGLVPSAADAWDRYARLRPEPPPCALRCADPDDQVFIDLAVAEGARWLLSKDRALLALARRAARLGVQVSTPGGWRLEATAQDACAAN
ncbi:PIN domain-containing protein [Caldimonas taiwanensis]|uniref:PIN domain-containing protein n=1 Tax=Caldimonas taiwanensis TaxID=307483 RepID=UPI001E3E2B30|nr:PIN domain-containing protein [Caldimonas taiwanensis]